MASSSSKKHRLKFLQKIDSMEHATSVPRAGMLGCAGSCAGNLSDVFEDEDELS